MYLFEGELRFLAVIVGEAVVQALPVGIREAAQCVAVAAELQAAGGCAGVEGLPCGRLAECRPLRQQALVGALRVGVVGIVGGEVVVEVGDGGFVGAVVV